MGLTMTTNRYLAIWWDGHHRRTLTIETDTDHEARDLFQAQMGREPARLRWLGPTPTQEAPDA